MNKPVLTIIIMLLSGVISPIVFFSSYYFGGELVQANVVSIKATITFVAGLCFLGYDKSYAYYSHRLAEPDLKYGFQLVFICYILGGLGCLGAVLTSGNIKWLAILFGIFGTGLFFLSRSYSIAENNYFLVNRFTLGYYFFNLLFIFLLSINEIYYFLFFNSFWILFALLLLLKNSFFTKFSFNLTKIISFINGKNLPYLKFGLGDFLSALTISAPIFLIVHGVENLNKDTEIIINIGLIFLLLNMVRYPFSALIPLLVTSKVEKYKVFQERVLLLSLFSVLVICCIVLGYLTLLLSYYLIPYFSIYKLVQYNFLLTSSYIVFSLFSFVLIYISLLRRRVFLVNTMNILKILAYLLLSVLISYVEYGFSNILFFMALIEFSSIVLVFLFYDK